MSISEEARDIAYNNRHDFTWKIEECTGLRWSNGTRWLVFIILTVVLILNSVVNGYLGYRNYKEDNKK